MKTMKMIKTGLVALLLSTSGLVFGQTGQTPPGPINPLGPQNTGTEGTTTRGSLFDPVIANFDNELTNAILFYNPDLANSFKLKASKIEDEANDRGLDFTKYVWSESTDGTNYTVIAGQETMTLSKSDLTPGYHYYKVKGIINPDNVDESLLCDTQEETFVVFVLPTLKVTTNGTSTNTTTNPYVFCENEANITTPENGQEKVTLTSSVSFDNYTGLPIVGDFEKTYRWYAIKKGTSNNYPDVSNMLKDPSLATGAQAILLGEGVSLNQINPQINTYGIYKVFVEVEYTIKGRSFGLQPDDPNNRNRPHVIYRGWFGGDDVASATEITVTPAPGKPHITIIEVTD
ncbi:hypothetical protein [Sphingobacterium faecale]|uniref:Uncharacterized protein n=1 Tax=Sphingobacterium faecale TaxID=2803775 RepID=A0ABS1R7E7_9SPHI|nr:hypothetical protein [Sphingobacterium faecale]MBL1410489.1 hypothetical protein [Sphingobacterium faecale]